MVFTHVPSNIFLLLVLVPNTSHHLLLLTCSTSDTLDAILVGRCCVAVDVFQHLENGRAHAPVLCCAGGSPRRASRCRRYSLVPESPSRSALLSTFFNLFFFFLPPPLLGQMKGSQTLCGPWPSLHPSPSSVPSYRSLPAPCNLIPYIII